MQPTEKKLISFYELLERELKDTRGKQGQHHYLPFVLFSYITGLITLRSNRSSVHRYMKNNFKRLCRLTGHNAVKCISYAQLGRVLRCVDALGLDSLSCRYFGIQLPPLGDSDWASGDGKDLKGSFDKDSQASRGSVLVHFVRHDNQQCLGSDFYDGNKESEITSIRNLLITSELSSKNTCLDGLHCNPETTQLIASEGGHYLIQAKAKHQKELVKDLVSKTRRLPTLAHIEELDKAHGRIEKRNYRLYHIEQEIFAKRWDKSELTTCIVVDRQTYHIKTGKQTTEKAFYISNAWLKQAPEPMKKKEIKRFEATNIAKAIRQHWSIEVNHYIRDVTFKEDDTKTPKSKTAKTIAILTSIALGWLKLLKPKNVKELAESMRDSPALFKKMMKKTAFI